MVTRQLLQKLIVYITQIIHDYKTYEMQYEKSQPITRSCDNENTGLHNTLTVFGLQHVHDYNIVNIYVNKSP